MINYYEIMKELVFTYKVKIKDKKIHFMPDIPIKKIEKFFKPLQIPAEKALVLMDDTLFRSGKYGLVVTECCLYVKEYEKIEVKLVKLNQIKSCGFTFLPTRTYLAINDNNKFFLVGGHDKESMSAFLELLQAITTIFKREKEINKAIQEAEINNKDTMGKIVKEIVAATALRRLTAPLIRASARGDLETIKLLLDKGADVNVEPKDTMTPLSLASFGGHAPVVKVLLEHGADPNYQAEAGATALIVAAGENHIDVVKILVNSGANLNIKDYTKGMTALMIAAFNDSKETIEFLLDKGADMNIQNNDGMTAMMLAILTDITRGSGIFGIYQRKIEKIKLFIDKGADENVIDKGGWTALMLAAYKNYPEIVKAMIESGADQKIRNKDGDTALELAKRKKWYKVVGVFEKS